MRRFLNGIILLLLGLSVAAGVCMVLMLLQENGPVSYTHLTLPTICSV